MKKTNAARLLDRLQIPYRLVEYDVDESDLGAENVARKVNMPLERVFKTLVTRGDRTGIFLACIPGGAELDLKAMAHVSGDKKIELVHLKEVQPLTGYVRGGVSPIGAKKQYPTYVDESALAFSEIAVSAGIRGCQILLDPRNLIRAVEARVGQIARGPSIDRHSSQQEE